MISRFFSPAILLALALAPAHVGGQNQQPGESDVVGEVFASDASVQGSVIFASGGTRLLSGSTVSAGAAAATVRLKRGGEVRVCPGSDVQVNSLTNPNQPRGLVLSLDTGMLEAHYSLPAGSDSVVTPDFRITFTGPGDFHVAIGADAHGNTCVQPLHGNNSAIIVSELMGEGSYQVKPNVGMYFLSGRVKQAVPDVPVCGCPVSAAPRTVQATQPQPVPIPLTPEKTTNAAAPQPPLQVTTQPPLQVATNQVPLEVTTQPAPGNVTQPLPSSQPSDVHVQVDAPVVFNAADPGAALEAEQLVKLPLTQLPWFSTEQVVPPTIVQTAAAPPQEKPKEKKKGFFGRLRGMFAALFGNKSGDK